MRKGFTIIEIMVASTIALLMGLCVLSIYTKYTLNYIVTISESREESSAQAAQLFLQNEFNNRVRNIDYINNKIKVTHSDNIKIDYIYFKSTGSNIGNIVIEYTQYGSTLGINNIIKNINSFYIEKQNNLMYLTIISKGGITTERCFNIKK